MGESAGKAATRFEQNFSGVKNDLREHPEKMIRHKPSSFDPELRFATNSEIQNYYPEIVIYYCIT